MRKILVPFALLGLVSLPMTACDVEEGTGDATTTTTTTTTTTDTTDTSAPKYFALIVDDSERFDGRCATSSSGAHGADIDAVELITDEDDSYFFAEVDYQPGTECTIGDQHDNASEVEGAPDGSLTDGFVALGGGLVAGEFDASAIQIMAGYNVVVYEIDDDYCTAAGLTPGVNCVGSEGYDVFITEQLSCVGTSNCSTKQITDNDGAEGEAQIPLSGF
ncbi:MAG: hypothetical protein IT385_25970 [Deltaproteobacteria bacterium]|nr:hypothetical protein [Deltaproteobacteria bacterium]